MRTCCRSALLLTAARPAIISTAQAAGVGNLLFLAGCLIARAVAADYCCCSPRAACRQRCPTASPPRSRLHWRVARGKAIGNLAAGAIAGAVGLPLGGWLADAIGWRAIFTSTCRYARRDLHRCAMPKRVLRATCRSICPAPSPPILALAIEQRSRAWSSHNALRRDHRGDRARRRGARHRAVPVGGACARRPGDDAGGDVRLARLCRAHPAHLPALRRAALVLIQAGGYSALHAGFALLPMLLGMGIVPAA